MVADQWLLGQSLYLASYASFPYVLTTNKKPHIIIYYEESEGDVEFDLGPPRGQGLVSSVAGYLLARCRCVLSVCSVGVSNCACWRHT